MWVSSTAVRRLVGLAAICLAVLLAAGAHARLFEKFYKGSGLEEPLLPEKAFQAGIKAIDSATAVATLTPAPEHYLYRNTVRFWLKDDHGMRLGSVQLPGGIKKKDPFFGETEVYDEPVHVHLPLERQRGGPMSVTVVASYQGCNARLGVCYPPLQTELRLSMR